MKHLISFTFLVLMIGIGVLPTAYAEEVSPEAIVGAMTVDAARAKSLFDQGVPFVDVRKDSDWDAGRIPGAEHLELKKSFTEKTLAEVVGKDNEVVIYCNGPKCMRSSKACTLAVSWDFKKIYYFRGGYPEWVAAGYPVE